MRRIRSVVAVAAVTGATAAFAGPAMAGVDFDDGRHKRFEERLDERAYLVEDSYDELEDAYEDGIFYHSPFVVYDIDDVWGLD
jgi:hypothetical protein